ncbi:MAG: hypothetical protein AB7L17_02335 [Ilumatobacteraceae bacterium]
MTPPLPRSTVALSRRSLLLGAAGLAGAGSLLAACGGGDDDSASTSTGGQSAGGDGFVINPRFPNSMVLTPGNVRLAFSISDEQGALLLDGPATISGDLVDQDRTVLAPIQATRHGTGLSVPYWSVMADIATPGIYGLRLDGAAGDAQAFLLVDPSEAMIPVPSQPLPPFDTPTVDDARGVDPICTRTDGTCPFHEITLTEALALGKPVVYMVGTPAHCQFATCGPGLEFLIDVAKSHPDVTFVHAEVYSDPEGTTVAPAVDAIGLDYEPVMWVTDAGGVVQRRIDIVWDESDLVTLLKSALG